MYAFDNQDADISCCFRPEPLAADNWRRHLRSGNRSSWIRL